MNSIVQLEEQKQQISEDTERLNWVKESVKIPEKKLKIACLSTHYSPYSLLKNTLLSVRFHFCHICIEMFVQLAEIKKN